MTKLIFFTTNRVKLAHFKYLGQKSDIRISGFREKCFYASYHEPRINDRETLLRESYFSALSQWKKANSGKDSGFFFLEDTSLRIEALSGIDSIPGVNVKFWMKGMTFSKLNRLLQDQGGDRRVTVRSDIILHIPKQLRDEFNLVEDFLWFYGETRGHIVDAEVKIKPHLLYPWLDSKTFNRWFVPEGYNSPISSLPIDQANNVDFRARAFDKLVQSLYAKGILQKEHKIRHHQYTLPNFSTTPPVFIVCGSSCAGKTTLAMWLRDNFGFMHIEASDFMYKAFWERHGNRSPIQIGDFAECALQHEPDIVANPIAEYLNLRRYSAVIISGFRSPKEIQCLQELLEPNRQLNIIYLEAFASIRLDRALNRGRDKVTKEKFELRDMQETRMGIEKIRQLCGVAVINNEKTINDLFELFSDQYNNFLAELATFPNAISAPSQNGELEDFILLTLLKQDIGLTTKEIADYLNRFFNQKKSKNNISRYFNQEFHAYYEITIVDRKARYRLSNTGVALAKLLNKASDSSTLTVKRKSPRKYPNHFDLFSDSLP